MKRTNSSRRNGSLALFLTIGILTVGGLAWGNYNRVPETPIPFTPMPAQNAYDVFVRATGQMVDAIGTANTDGPKRVLDKKTGRNVEVKPNDADLAELVRSNRAAIETLRSGLGLPYVPPAARSVKHLFPEFAKFRSMSRMLIAVGKYHESKGDLTEAARCYGDAIALGRKIPHHSVLIGELVGIACEAIGRKAMFELADKLSPDQARTVLARLDSLEADRFPHSGTIGEEKWFIQATLREMFRSSFRDMAAFTGTDDEDSGGQGRQAIVQTVLLAFTNKRRVLADNAGYMDQLAKNAELSYEPSRRVANPPTDIVNKLLLPVFDQAGFKAFSTRADDALLRAYIAARAFARETGGEAKSLDDLVQAGFLSMPIVDPFSPKSEPIRLTKIDGKITPYSIGPDAIDNGGEAIAAKKGENGKIQRYVNADDRGDQVARVNTY